VRSISPFLWFDDGAEEAANLYVKTFNGKILSERRWGPDAPAPEGSLMAVTFELDGRAYQAFNGGPGHPFSDSFSLSVELDTQQELDAAWDALLEDGGRPVACGWLADKFGVSWQLVPSVLQKLLSDPDPARAGRAMRAMLGMVKLDIAALQAASDG
jgi:predicted 3-demethylubiquinone-9 3-methyltransferase (glyoxalase superfamily)